MHQSVLKIRQLILIIFLIFCSVDAFALPVYNEISHNSDTLGKYQKFEITVDMTANFVNPFDYEQVHLRGHFISPSGEHIYVDGFYYQDYLLNDPDPVIPNGDPIWKVRFSPDEIGTWTYELICSDGTGTTWSGTYSFVCISSTVPGFVSNANEYFQEFDDGTPFFPIGMSIPWNFGEGGFYTYEDWIDSLAANKANFFKIIMAPWSFGIEWDNTGLGNYTNRLDIAFWIDRILNKAEEEDMYLQICILEHNEVSSGSSNQWAFSPYNVENGGPCNNTWDFYTNSEAKRFYKRRLRYINSRWGYSPFLSSWELLSETDNTGDFNDHRTSINNWLVETAQFIDSVDINNHLISTSYAFFENDPDMWNNEVMDFTHIHKYNNSNDLELKLNSATRQYLDDYGKPNIIGEFGLDHDPVIVGNLDPNGISFHNSLWATSLSGSFGAAVAWHWDSYIDEQNLYYHFEPVSLFMQSIDDLSVLDYKPISVHTTADVNLDLVIQPKFSSLFTPAPEDQFTIETTGNIIPRAEELSTMLYGYTFNNSRNPPHFQVNYTQDGQFSLVTGNTALFSNIKIWIDGVNVINETGHSNTTYTIDVSEGEHIIFVENTGNFYIEVDSYLFFNYVPVCRSFALQDSTKIVGWLQNKNYNHEYINENGDPPSISGGILEFENLHESYYEVEWWNCSSGSVDSTVLHVTDDGLLTLDAPPVVWDAAYKISWLPVVITPSYTASTTDLCIGDTVTFSDSSTGIIESRFWQFPGGTPSTSTEENPTVVYLMQGSHNVSLTLYNQFDSATLVKTSYIVVETQPGNPGDIYGDTLVCVGQEDILYYVDPIPNADEYEWLLPFGVTGASITNEIYLSFIEAVACNIISVKGKNECGEGNLSHIYVCVNPLPSIIQHPGDTIACLYDNVTFTTETLPGMSYQWQISMNSGGTWDNLFDNTQYNGTNQYALLISGCTLEMNGNQYRCIVSNECEPPAITNPALLTVVPGGWDYTVTDLVHIINVPLLVNPTINDEPIDPGDYIGVFYQDGETQKCGGTQQWNGVEGISIFAYGDDPSTAFKDGFTTGEDFSWQIYSQADWEGYEAEATFLFGPDYFSADAFSTIIELNAIAYINHLIEIPAGWSGISSYVIPENDTIHHLFNPMGDTLIILMDMQNIFWPEQQIDEIINWDPYTGYKIKVDTATQLIMTGLDEADKIISLQAGWSILPVLSDKNVSTIETGIFIDLGDTLQIVVEIAGTDIYWPAEDILTLTMLKPGKAYMINVYNECMIVFPEVVDEPKYWPSTPDPEVEVPWNKVVHTPSSHCFSFAPGLINMIHTGDVIAALNESGHCGGQVIVNDMRPNRSLVLFGDDPTTPYEIEGFMKDDQIFLRVFRPSTGEIFEIDALYDTDFPNQGNFRPLGLSRINNITLHPLLIQHPDPLINIQLFPNPVEDMMSIYIDTPHQPDYSLEIYSIDGQLMQKMSLNTKLTKLYLSTFASGIYLLKISNSTEVYYKKILKK